MEKKLGMVIFRCKDSKLLQIVSTAMLLGCQEVQKINGQNLLHVRFADYILEYQKTMDGMDRGNQHRTVGTGFANVDNFQK